MPTITLYSTYYGLTQNIPSWDDTTPVDWLRGVEAAERAYVACTGLQRVFEGHPEYDRAPFEVFEGRGFRIISRRYA